MILTIFVAQWSNRKVRREFNCSHQLISQTKEVLITKGVLSTPNPKKREITTCICGRYGKRVLLF